MTDDSISVSGDRLPPPKVPDILDNGIRYSQRVGSFDNEFQQAGGLLDAFDAKTNKRLWTLVVYPNKRKPDLEGDVQDVFFKSMKFQHDGKMHIEDEVGREYIIDVKKRTSTLKKSHK